MEDILHIVMTWSIPTLLTTVTGFLIKIVRDNIAMKKSNIAMLRSQIVSKVEKYMELGHLPDYARFCLEDLFKQYKALGGNHGIETLVEQCFNLPPIKRGGK